MSFLSQLYSKIVPGSRVARRGTFVDQNLDSSDFVEEYDQENGFVMLTEKPPVCKQGMAWNSQGRIAYDQVQNSSANSFPPGPSLYHTYPGSSFPAAAPLQEIKQKKDTTFLTVSDVPLKLAKPLEVALKMSAEAMACQRTAPLNIEQYCYDFHLERTILHATEGQCAEHI